MDKKKIERYELGIEKLKELKGEAAAETIERLTALNPDLAQFVMEFPFGDIYTRPQLDIKSREIATIASLTTMGNAPEQLKVHIQAALNIGITRKEIIEIILQMAVYAGFPAAINAMKAATEVFEEIGNEHGESIENGKPGTTLQTAVSL